MIHYYNTETFLEKYANIKVKFFLYWNKTFHFKTYLTEGSILVCHVNDDSTSLNDCEITCEDEYFLVDLRPSYAAVWTNNVQIEAIYDY